MPTALVVGATSMLGKRLVAQLQAHGWQVITAGRQPECEVFVDLGAAPWTGRADQQADVLFHCAAAFADDSPQGCWLNETVNALGSLQVLALSEAFACRQLIYAGSISSSYRQAPTELGSYGASKLRGEQLLEWGMARQQVSFCSLRLAQLYDERGECAAHQWWFSRIVAYAAAGQDLRLPPGAALRNFVHVDDAAALLIRAAREHWRGVRSVVHPRSLSTAEIAEQAYAVFAQGGRVRVADDKQPFREVFIPQSDLLDYPFRSLEQGLSQIRAGGYGQGFAALDVA